MKENPTIKINNIGRRYFNYTIYMTRKDGSLRMINKTACAGEEIEIPVSETEVQGDITSGDGQEN